VKELIARASGHGRSLHASAYRGYRKDPPVPGIEAFLSVFLRSHQGSECKSEAQKPVIIPYATSDGTHWMLHFAILLRCAST
jgi:hypothetical protein